MVKLRQSERALAQRQSERAVQQAKQREITPDAMDERRASLEVAQEQVAAAEAAVIEARTALGLDAAGNDPAAVPEGIEHDFIGVKTAGYEFARSLADLGYPLQLDIARAGSDTNPLAQSGESKGFHEQLEQLAAQAPSVRLAAAHVGQFEQRVRQAELAIQQTEIRVSDCRHRHQSGGESRQSCRTGADTVGDPFQRLGGSFEADCRSSWQSRCAIEKS